MRDYIDGRIWADFGHRFSEDVAALLKTVNDAFCRLNRIEFDAPWRPSNPNNC